MSFGENDLLVGNLESQTKIETVPMGTLYVDLLDKCAFKAYLKKLKICLQYNNASFPIQLIYISFKWFLSIH